MVYIVVLYNLVFSSYICLVLMLYRQDFESVYSSYLNLSDFLPKFKKKVRAFQLILLWAIDNDGFVSLFPVVTVLLLLSISFP